VKKQITYRYNGVESSDETEIDHDGDIPVTKKDQMIPRNGKLWKVVHVIEKTSVTDPTMYLVVLVFLTDQP
jgi:hypothetical protein